MKQDLATAYRQMKSPNIKTKRGVKANPRSETRKKKNNRDNWTHIVGLFLREALTGATLQQLSIQSKGS